MKKKIYLEIFAIAVLVVFCGQAYADWNPGGCMAAPPGTKGMLTYFRHYTANEKYSDGKKVSQNEDFEMDLTIFRPIFWFEKFDIVFAPQILQPVGSKSYATTYAGEHKINLDQRDSGMGDTQFALGIWPVHDYVNGTFLLCQIYVIAPTGDYSNDKILNMGENRWQYKFETGLLKKIPKTDLSIEVGGGLTFHGDNDEYGASKIKQKQDTSYSFQASLIYDLIKGHNISVTGYYNRAGEKTVGGVKQDDEGDNFAAQIGFGWAMSKHSQLFLKYKKDIEVDEGLKMDVMAARWTYLF